MQDEQQTMEYLQESRGERHGQPMGRDRSFTSSGSRLIYEAIVRFGTAVPCSNFRYFQGLGIGEGSRPIAS